MEKLFIDSDDVVEMLGISKSKAYVLIRTMNNELKSQGYVTIPGKVNKKYFCEKIYGFEQQ